MADNAEVDFYNHNDIAAFYLDKTDDGVRIDVIKPNSSDVTYSVDFTSDEAIAFAGIIDDLAGGKYHHLKKMMQNTKPISLD